MFGRFSFWQRSGNHPSTSATMEPTTEEADRRVWVRFAADLETTYQKAGQADSSRLSAKVRDISRGGVNLLVRHSFQPGDMLSVELPAPEGRPLHTVLACVVRVNQEGEDWSLGCIFSCELDDDDLEGFGAKREKHSDADQRTWMRYPCQVKATYQVVGYEETPVCQVEVLNISASGIGILVGQPIEMGSLLNLELQQAGGASTRTILACVVHANQENGRWALGCNFIRELSEDDLQALVSV
jgi:c-di-GMP-binding flagellar brake protein YcgR